MDDLTQIKGIGPMRAADLAAHNIDTFQALATADADFLVKTMEVTPTMIAGWQKAAAALEEDQIAKIDSAAVAHFTAVLGVDVAGGDDETAVYEHLLTGKIRR